MAFLWTDVLKRNLDAWTFGTYSTKSRKRKISEHGNEADKANLGSATRYNQRHKTKRIFNHIYIFITLEYNFSLMNMTYRKPRDFVTKNTIEKPTMNAAEERKIFNHVRNYNSNAHYII